MYVDMDNVVEALYMNCILPLFINVLPFLWLFYSLASVTHYLWVPTAPIMYLREL